MSEKISNNTSANNKRIAKNTLFMYIRMVIVMTVTLYTSRVVLKSLGVEDFGIYNVVGGIIAMFRIFNGALTDASQRFITFELGKGENGDVTKIFSQCLILHFLLGFIVVVFAEPIGIWFLYNKLMIPPERLDAAFWIYQFTIISMFVMFISVPYNALIVAHEKMKAFAMISIVEAFLRLGVAYALYIEGVDKLILYGFLMLLTQICLRFIYTLYCKKEIKASTFKFTWDKETIKEMGRFASWTILGNMSYLSTTQGLNLLLGVFFPPVVNAARGIAVQVQGAVETFVRNFQTAINPQITKNYAAGKIETMIDFVFVSSRFSFFLMMIPMMPLLFETNQILELWLGTVPEYTVVFVRVILLVSWISTLLNPLEISVKASGKIRNFEIVIYGLKFCILPISYILLKYYGYSPIYVFVIQFEIDIVALCASIRISSKILSFNVGRYINDVIFCIMPVVIVTTLVPLVVVSIMEKSVLRVFVLIIFSLLWSLLVVLILGTSYTEKKYIKNKLKCKVGF